MLSLQNVNVCSNMQFTSEVLRVIRLYPCQPDHALRPQPQLKRSPSKFYPLCCYEKRVIQSPRSSVITSLVNLLECIGQKWFS